MYFIKKKLLRFNILCMVLASATLRGMDFITIADPITNASTISQQDTENMDNTRSTQGSKLQYFPGNVIIQDTLKVREIFANIVNIANAIPVNNWSLVSVPWTNWQYFVGVLSGTTASALWVPSNGINGIPYTGASQRNFGTVTMNIETAGTYSFSFAYQAQNNTGIATFVINGITTSIDTYYAFSTVESFTWTQVLGVGIYTITLSSLTKNVASSDYWLQFIGDGLAIRRVS